MEKTRPTKEQPIENAKGEILSPDMKLAARYMRLFLEARTMGKRAHSWEHTQLVADRALESLESFAKLYQQPVTEDEKFSVFVGSLLHDAIQPDDIENRDLSEQMHQGWGFSETGDEFSEGSKAFDYVVGSLKNKLEEEHVPSGVQTQLITRLIANRDTILHSYTQKEKKKNPTEWFTLGRAEKCMVLGDTYDNMTPDILTRSALIEGYNAQKKDKTDFTTDDAVDSVLGLFKGAASGEGERTRYYRFFHDHEIRSELEQVAYDVIENYDSFLRAFRDLEEERGALTKAPELRTVMKENNIGVYGIFARYYRAALDSPRINTIETFDQLSDLLSKEINIEELSKQRNLSREQEQMLREFYQCGKLFFADLQKHRDKIKQVHQSWGIK